MAPRFSALPLTDVRALMTRRDSQTVALFVHRCLCVVDDELEAQRAQLLLVCSNCCLRSLLMQPTGRPELGI